ncbi:ferritin-like fold-containing protein [Cellulomonas edaphi]|uniref:Ferritin-like fold-containing protein n=1 Tax=Cellulomonas edaphi TaxID=3053468 RepID=A0ABT7SA36_9CELL|nr:ferritin-like fold-containing protein [Cellulomons edaphi]MDM7831892.1 ferritin-like fold-containing protein [Cellulomons edaphi]
MTTTRPDAASQPAVDRSDAPANSADVVELLGLVAHLEHTAFVRLANDSAIAPTVGQRLELSRFAAAAVERRDRVLARVVELGAEPEVAMGQFVDVLVDFDERTQPSTWWERLLKAYVGYGVADDFCRIVAEGLDERSREIVLEVLDDASHADLAVTELDAAGSDDGVLTSRLALWGRRLVGEALGVVQGLLTQRPALARLLARSDERTAAANGEQPAPAAAVTTNAPAKVFSELTAQHTRRMSRLGLTP